MNALRYCSFFGFACCLSVPASAGPRSSTNYAVIADSIDCGGRRNGSANYTHDGSIGGSAVAALSTAASYVNKAGFVSQLTDVVGVLVSAPSTTLAEGSTLQLGAAQVLDDSTTLRLAPDSVAWSVSSGPVAGISSSGLLSAGLVYQDTPATARGDFGGFSGTFNLQVLDTLPDNFGSYAGDGIDDSWQVQYFGLNNPNAAPSVDFSGTGQTNLFKFVAGLNPLDPAARFIVTAAPVAGQPSQKLISFGPVLAGRTYSVRAKADMASSNWSTVAGSVLIVGSQGTLLDTAAIGAKKFYEVQIVKP